MNHQEKTKRRNLIIILIVSSLLILTGILIILQLIPSSSVQISEKPTETIENSPKKINILKNILPFAKKQNQSETNLLILGRPGQGYSGSNLTDTILLVHLKPADQKAVLISLPRDLLIKNPKTGGLTKINALYTLTGIQSLKAKIEEITGLEIDDYIIIDLVAAKEIIELVDGLNVYVPQDIHDPYFPGPNHTYQSFNLAAGWRYLDGDTALRYIRTRYTSPNGDFDRMARQQQVINLLKQKVLTLNLLWDFPTYLKIFNSLNDHIQTDLSLLELRSLWKIAKNIDPNQITNIVIDKKETDLLIGNQIMLGQTLASVILPKAGQGEYQAVREHIQKGLNK